MTTANASTSANTASASSTPALQRTPLHAAHLRQGAKMVDFAGWDMPIHYGSQIEEHQTVRQAAGMFDVSHMLCIDITGSAAKSWLQHMLANDVARLQTPGKALYACLLREDGGIIDDLIVYYLTPTHYRLVVNASRAERDLSWLQAHVADFDVALKPRRDLAMIAIQGPQAREKFWQACPDQRNASAALASFHSVLDAEHDWQIARTGYTGEDGFEICLPASQAEQLWQQLLAAGVRPCGLGCRDTLRLEAGLNLYGQDMDESINPLDAGLAWTLALQDARDFIGKTALQAQQARHQFTGLLLLERGVLRAGQRVVTPQGEGEITSGTFSPTLQQGIALARLPLTLSAGDMVSVDIRGKLLQAKVVKPPFVRHGQSLVA